MVKLRKRTLFWVAISLAGLAVVLLLVALWPPQRNLLLRSQRVLALPGDPTGSEGLAQYYWQSDTHLVTSTFDGAGFAVEAVDLDTHTQRPVASLSYWVWLDDQWDKTLSPDGRWALASVPHTALFAKPNGKWAIPLSAEDSSAASNTTLVALSDSQGGQKSTQAVFSGTVSYTFWLSDSRHWAIALNTHNGWFLEVHDRTQPKLVTLTPIQHDLRAQMNELWGNPFGNGIKSQPGASNDAQLLFVPVYYDTADRSFRLLIVNAGSTPAQAKSVTVTMPSDPSYESPFRGSTVVTATASPDGKSVAWVLDFQERQKKYPTAWDNFREQWIKGQMPLDPQPYPTEEIWVSRSDGTKMHELAHLPAPNGYRQLTNLRWTPSGRQISFVYKNNLYTMPATDRWHE